MRFFHFHLISIAGGTEMIVLFYHFKPEVASSEHGEGRVFLLVLLGLFVFKEYLVVVLAFAIGLKYDHRFIEGLELDVAECVGLHDGLEFRHIELLVGQDEAFFAQID
jgi:hypothetical protein